MNDAGLSESDCKADQKRARNREASRRFREKKKKTERALAEENAILRDAMDALRKKMQGAHVEVLEAARDKHTTSMLAATQHVIAGLPEALVPTIQKALEAQKNVRATVAGLMRDLPRVIPAVAFSEINYYTFLQWVKLHREGIEPTDALQRDIFNMWSHPERKELQLGPDMIQHLLEFYSQREERLTVTMAKKRRLRQLLEEAAALGADLEKEDAWFAADVDRHVISVLSAEQVAARFAWIHEHAPAIQDAVIGYRLEVPSPEARSPEDRSPAAEPPPQPPRKRPADDGGSSSAEPHSPHAPGPGHGHGPAGVVGIHLPPDLLRSLIREAIANEFAHLVPAAAGSACSSPAVPAQASPHAPFGLGLLDMHPPPSPDLGLLLEAASIAAGAAAAAEVAAGTPPPHPHPPA